MKATHRILHVLAVGALLVQLVAAETPGETGSSDALPKGAILRVGSLRWRAPGAIVALAFRKDGREVVTVGQDQAVIVWDAATGKELRRFDGSGPATTPQLSPGSLQVGRAVLSADGSTLVAIGRARILNVWDVETGRHRRKLGATEGNQIAVSRDGKFVAVAESSGQIRLWDTTTESPTKFLRGDSETERSYSYRLDFSADGKTLLQVGLNYPGNGDKLPNVVTFDVATGKELKRLGELPENAPANTVLRVFGSPDLKSVFVPLTSSIAVMDLGTGKERSRLKDVDDLTASTFLVRPDGKELVQVIARDQVVVWDVEKGAVARRFGVRKEADARRGIAPNTTISPDGTTIALAEGAMLALVDLKTGVSRGGIDAGHSTALLGAYYSPDGKTILTRSEKTYIRWDAATGEFVERFDVPAEHSNFLLTRDAKWMVATSLNLTLTVYDWERKKEPRVIATGAQGGYTYTVLPDSRTLAVLGRPASHVVLYDITTGQKTGELTLPPYDPNREADAGSLPRRITTSRDARFVAGCTETAVVIWDLLWMREVQRIDIPTDRVLRHIAFGPDGRTLIIEFYGGEVGVWEVASGSRRRVLREAEKNDRTYFDASARLMLDGSRLPSALAASQDGRMVAAAGTDRKVRVWDVRTGKELGSFTGHRGPITGVSFSIDCTRLVSACSDTSALVWDLAPMRANLAPMTATKTDGAWEALIQPEGERAFGAILALAAEPAKGIAMLREHLKPIAAPDEKMLAQLVADLNSAKYPTRVKAKQELEKLGELAQPALKAAFDTTTSAEVRAQAKRLLKLLSQRRLTPEQMRHVRAVEALELAATPEARELLTALAKGAPAAPLTSEANAALERLTEK